MPETLVKITISDIRKALNSPNYMWDGLDLIVDKLEELENENKQLNDKINILSKAIHIK